jgi:hypothetical protein
MATFNESYKLSLSHFLNQGPGKVTRGLSTKGVPKTSSEMPLKIGLLGPAGASMESVPKTVVAVAELPTKELVTPQSAKLAKQPT